MTDAALPAEFADLNPYASAWALACERDRQRKRATSPMAEVRAFYDAAFPRLEAIIGHLDRYRLEDIESGRAPSEVCRLHRLALACMEASHPIEMHWAATDIDDAFPIDRLVFLPPSNQR